MVETRKVSAYAWCLTINNPTQQDYQVIEELLDPCKLYENRLIHMVVGYEHFNIVSIKYCKNRTLHLQVALCFSEKRDFANMKLLFPRAHIETLRSAYARAVRYCLKEEGAIQKQVGSFAYANFHLYDVLVSGYVEDPFFDHCVLLFGAKDRSELQNSLVEKGTSRSHKTRGDKGGVSITPPLPPDVPPYSFDEWELDRLKTNL